MSPPVKTMDNEEHMIFECPRFDAQRKKFLESVTAEERSRLAHGTPTIKSQQILTSRDPTTSRLFAEEIREELTDFLKSAVSARTTRAADFWGEPAPGGRGEGKKCYPNLYPAARHFLCLSGSNARVERFFSAGQQLLETKRRAARLSDETPGQLLLLHANGKSLGFP